MEMIPIIRTGIGQSKHRFASPESSKPCVIAGCIFDDTPGFQANSDGDVVFYALCNAITSLTHVPIICGIALEMCQKEGVTDSEVYFKEAIKTLHKQKISSISIAIEAKRPILKDSFYKMRQNIARIAQIEINQVGITAITGDGLSDCGCGEGVQCFAIITTYQ